MPGIQTPYHHGSHQELLQVLFDPLPIGPGIDAILVPTASPATYLRAAEQLARRLSCTLVTLHSGQQTSKMYRGQHASALEAAEIISSEVDLIAIDVAPLNHLNLPLWETSKLLADEGFVYGSDISPKRNVALMLSHMLGWSRILFLDDDITGIDPADVYRASGLLGAYTAVGLNVIDFPDNSVACHAYRLAGGEQKSFIGAGALVVDADMASTCDAFFPHIYNEDWFFLLTGEKGLPPTALMGEVSQIEYDPFDKPARARDEEFGDVLAEGIYWLLDQNLSIQDADSLQYWAESLKRRRLFIARVLELLSDSPLDSHERTRRRVALQASLNRLDEISPELCQRYIRAWATDRLAWRDHLDQLPTSVDRLSALRKLSRTGVPHLTSQIGGRSNEPRIK